MRRAQHRLRRAADADPGLQPAGFGFRKDALVLQRRAGAALPGDRLLLQDGGKQIELVVEQLFVLVEVEAEQRKRLDERAAAEDDLGAAVGDGVQGGEALKHPDRIVRRQHRHRGAEPDAAGAGRDRGQHHLRRRHREVGAVMFADADEIDAGLIGQHRFVDQIADDLRPRAAAGHRRPSVTSPKVSRPSSIGAVMLLCGREVNQTTGD